MGQPQASSVPTLPDEKGSVISGLDTEGKSVHEGTVTYDIRFRAIAPGSGEPIGLIVDVEAQSDYYPKYPLTKWGIYICCRMALLSMAVSLQSHITESSRKSILSGFA